jgi:hypothetical protein
MHKTGLSNKSSSFIVSLPIRPMCRGRRFRASPVLRHCAEPWQPLAARPAGRTQEYSPRPRRAAAAGSASRVWPGRSAMGQMPKRTTIPSPAEHLTGVAGIAVPLVGHCSCAADMVKTLPIRGVLRSLKDRKDFVDSALVSYPGAFHFLLFRRGIVRL